jgi:phenol 2-monooxygenase
LIDYDREWAKMISAPLKSADDPESEGVDPAEIQRYFVKHGRYTAGTATRYTESALTAAPTHQALAAGFPIGMRFHSAPVVRLGDGKAISLGHVAKADGRWRIYAFCDRGDPSAPASPIRQLCDFLAGSAASPIRKFTPASDDIDSVIDVRAVFQQPHRELDIGAMPGFLLPAKGRYGLRDYEKMYCANIRSGQDIFDMRGIDRDRGCMIVVRPDQYVAHILPLQAVAELSAFFDRFLIKAD